VPTAAPRDQARRSGAGLMKYPSDPPPPQAPARLHQRGPALVSGISHYRAPADSCVMQRSSKMLPGEPLAPLAALAGSALPEAHLRACSASMKGRSAQALTQALPECPGSLTHRRCRGGSFGMSFSPAASRRSSSRTGLSRVLSIRSMLLAHDSAPSVALADKALPEASLPLRRRRDHRQLIRRRTPPPPATNPASGASTVR
jgi:hypothetical protein